MDSARIWPEASFDHSYIHLLGSVMLLRCFAPEAPKTPTEIALLGYIEDQTTSAVRLQIPHGCEHSYLTIDRGCAAFQRFSGLARHSLNRTTVVVAVDLTMSAPVFKAPAHECK